MSDFCGYITKDKPIIDNKQIEKMNNLLTEKKSNKQNTFIYNKVALGHTQNNKLNIDDDYQSIKKTILNNDYAIVFNGKIFNTTNLTENLISKGYMLESNFDAELVLKSYILYGTKCLDMFNGNYAFVIYDISSSKIFLARDRLGIKPLFYTIANDNSLVFASQIKSILKYNSVERILDKEGLMELIGLGPAHSPGKTYFKNIFEIEAGTYATYDMKDIKKYKYWDLTTKKSLEDEDIIIKNIRKLVVDATNLQLVSDDSISSMLSGGLDSSILTKIASKNIKDLTTYSINYKGNDTDFKANDYQLTKDSDYVKIMNDYLPTNHKNIQIESNTLYKLLDSCLLARDMPGMADIDSSMYAFCKEIKKDGCNICLSGECSDEIFGGYPWYYKEHLISHNGFPWALSENLRFNLIKKDLIKKETLNNYIQNAIDNTLKNVSFLENEDEYEKKFRQINYLTIKWFMNTLIERTDRTSSANSLEVRIPFADYRIFEYVYNIPARMKLGIYNSSFPVEKYLLRKAFEGELPDEIIYRKKSPFPKTYNPLYLELVENKVLEIISKENSKISKILNFDFIKDMILIHGKNMTENLFGQLMTYPQTLAYIIQIDKWLEYYKIKIEL
ncbi:MAG: asparagine synthase (glutamine-hydrolyzing) [Clostridia bacterium]